MARIDRFELRGLLGQGGFGEVLRAYDPASGHEVALKRLGADAWVDAELRARFLREAEALTRVRDPGLVEVLETGVHEGRPWLAMRLVPGESLEARLRRGPLPVEQALAIARAVGITLGRLHARGVVHRDLKPQNVMLTPAGDPVLLDLGLALLLDASQRLTSSGESLGTPGYMSPEQAAGRLGDMGPATDVYGLGALLHALLTGEPPFRGAGTLQVLQAVLTASPAPPSRARPGLPPWLDQLVLRCLAKQPQERPDLERLVAALTPDATEVRQGLAGDRDRTRPSVPGAAPVRPRRRRLALLGLAAAGAASLLLLRPAGVTPLPLTPGPGASSAPVLSANGLMDRSVARYAQGDLDGSARDVEAALALDPKLARAHVARGQFLAKRGDRAGALAACERAIELDPKLPLAYLDRAALREALRGDVVGALQDYDRALELDPSLVVARVNRGLSKVQHGQLTAGLVDLEAALRAAPDDPQALAALALVLQEQPLQRERALRLLERALELDPRSGYAWNARGLARRGAGDLPGAIEDFSRALEVDPRCVSALGNRAVTHERLGAPDRAREDYDRALLMDPESARAWVSRADLRRRQGDLQGALGDLDRAVALGGTDPRATYARAVLRHQLGDLEGARGDVELTLERDPGHRPALRLRSLLAGER